MKNDARTSLLTARVLPRLLLTPEPGEGYKRMLLPARASLLC